MENIEKFQARETFSKKSKKVKMWFAISIEIQRSGTVNNLAEENFCLKISTKINVVFCPFKSYL